MSQCGFYFISVVVENLSASLQVVSEIVILYVVAVLVSVTGGEHRIFLLRHLELEAKGLALECQFSLSWGKEHSKQKKQLLVSF